MALYNKEFYTAHREQVSAYNRKLRARKREDPGYHHPPPRSKISFCSDPTCGEPLGMYRYNEHYCSRECYLRSFDKYRHVVIS